LKSNHEGELQRRNSDHDAQIKGMRSELDVLRKEKSEREAREATIPKEQAWILFALPVASEGGNLSIKQLALAVDLPLDQLEVHFQLLQQANLIDRHAS